jgi:hypothetical protein
MSSVVLRIGTRENAPYIPRRLEPLTVGVPLPMRLTTAGGFTGRDEQGRPIAIQSQVLDRWPDGSARWVLIDLQTDVNERSTASLDVGTALQSVPALGHMDGERAIVRTGAAEFVFSTAACPFERVTTAAAVIDPAASGLFVTFPDGATAQFRVRTVAFELNGALRAVVRLDGAFGDDDGLRARLRVHCFAGKATVRIDVTIHNPRAAKHPDGIWELGDAGSVLVKEVAMRLALAGSARRVQLSETIGAPLVDRVSPIEIYQDSSGGEHWDGSIHVNREGRMPLSFRGYRVETNGEQSFGHRATPIVRIDTDAGPLTLAVPRFWENFPKAITVGESLAVGLFPGQSADLHEIQGGEQKTETIWIAFADDDTTETPLEWCRVPSTAIVSPEWCEQTQAIPFLTAAAADPHDGYKALIANVVEGPDSFFVKREAIDEYGWRHFGDVYGDHEAVFEKNTRLVSHYNNQYDPIAGCAIQFLRTGDLRWRTLMDDLARHVADIDIYHTDRDAAKYNHGLFWHTVHYIDAGRSTHRTYPKAKGSNGGGPSAGHLYATGLMLQYFMTGEQQFRDALEELGTFVLDSDDGAKSIFKWLDRGPTGLISDSVDGYHGPGRASGNALETLIDVHRVTSDRRFLDKAEELIRRCIHPGDDIEQHNLLDAERRWFYTMFLQSLGKYLWAKRELGQIDVMYAYGQASLLAYARWMAAHERPTLDHPENLDYPTETWAAQDMRKCEVFQWAALHADGDDRARFLERAGFFFNYSVRALTAMETRTLARPMILLLAFGWARNFFIRPNPPREPAAPAGIDFGVPQRFIPQKVRAMARAKRIAIVGLAATALAVAGTLIAYFK